MNRSLLFLSSAVILAGSVSMTSCKSRAAVANDAIGKEIKIPCAGPKYTTDDKFFRASMSGESSDMSFSKEKALTLTRQQLAASIETKIKSVTERYAKEREISNKFEFDQKVENITREVVKQTLIDIRTACEQTNALPNGNFRTFVALEVEKETLYNGLTSKISANAALKQDFEISKFREVFEDEMKKFEEENN
jgi:hypothetical protein